MSRRAATLRAVTLIELLAALVVVAILAAIAVPSYRSYVIRSQRTDAMAALLRIQAAQEKFFLQHHRYARALAPPPPEGLGFPEVSENGHYALALETPPDANPLAFVAVATPQPGGGSADDARCRRFSIDQNGLRRALDAAGEDRTAECWR